MGFNGLATSNDIQHMKISVDCDCNTLFSSQYIDYLRNNFEVSFNKKPFDSIPQKGNLFLFMTSDGKATHKFAIDFADSSMINKPAYEWCCAYGKINYNESISGHAEMAKLVRIAPSFGVKIWTKYEVLWNAVLHYLRSPSTMNFKSRILKYLSQNYRLKLSEYRNRNSDSKYIFFISSLWNTRKHCRDEYETNNSRATFIRACKQISALHFEGGFAPNTEMGNFADLFYGRRVSTREYIDKTCRSACVFNTPAVFSCHGWKLGEYLALGKAIISTPLTNELPARLEHGVNIHFVSGEEDELIDAINKICSDDTYRMKLENGALQYWLAYGHPKNAIHSLFSKASLV